MKTFIGRGIVAADGTTQYIIRPNNMPNSLTDEKRKRIQRALTASLKLMKFLESLTVETSGDISVTVQKCTPDQHTGLLRVLLAALRDQLLHNPAKGIDNRAF